MCFAQGHKAVMLVRLERAALSQAVYHWATLLPINKIRFPCDRPYLEKKWDVENKEKSGVMYAEGRMYIKNHKSFVFFSLPLQVSELDPSLA